jgi:hypothetical protein
VALFLRGTGGFVEPRCHYREDCRDGAAQEQSGPLPKGRRFHRGAEVVKAFAWARQQEDPPFNQNLSLDVAAFDTADPPTQVFLLINAERRDRKLTELEREDSAMTILAYNHSREMARYLYMSHSSPLFGGDADWRWTVNPIFRRTQMMGVREIIAFGSSHSRYSTFSASRPAVSSTQAGPISVAFSWHQAGPRMKNCTMENVERASTVANTTAGFAPSNGRHERCPATWVHQRIASSCICSFGLQARAGSTSTP